MSSSSAVQIQLNCVPAALPRRRITGLHSALYSLLTPCLALAGATYLLAPGMSLAHVLGYVKGVDTFFWWQLIGGGLATVAPSITYSLKVRFRRSPTSPPAASSPFLLASARCWTQPWLTHPPACHPRPPQKLADDGRLHEPVAKILNVGLLAAGAGHLSVLSPMLSANQGGPALPWVVGAWATALMAAGTGLFGGGSAKAAKP